jgi:recA bacterial DNA recombination protein
MSPAATKKKVETVLAHRYGRIFERRKKLPTETLPTGIVEIDRLLHGIPRGAITEIHGAASSGRTSVLLSALAVATAQEDTCALVDCHDTFDVSSAAKATVDLNRLLWVRCSNNLERAFKAVDLLLHGGGFGLVALSIGDVPARAVGRIISSWWFRFRRTIENTSTALIVITPVACTRSCASLVLELKSEAAVWSSTLSLVTENGNGRFTESRERVTSHLSLVATTSLPATNSSLSHAHFIQGQCVHVNRERPVQWSTSVVKFNTRLH